MPVKVDGDSLLIGISREYRQKHMLIPAYSFILKNYRGVVYFMASEPEKWLAGRCNWL
jgi:hypothetical protein